MLRMRQSYIVFQNKELLCTLNLPWFFRKQFFTKQKHMLCMQVFQRLDATSTEIMKYLPEDFELDKELPGLEDMSQSMDYEIGK